MTLAVAAKYPWGVLRHLEPFQPGGLREAIIFVTDSRFTYEYQTGTGVKYNYEDVGAKLYAMGNMGLAYAGDVLAAEQSIAEIGRKLGKSGKVVLGINEVVRRVYHHHRRRRLNGLLFPLHLLMGTVIKGKANLLCFRSPDFLPEQLNDLHGVGVVEVYGRLKEKVSERLKEIVDEELAQRTRNPWINAAGLSIKANAERVALEIASIMHKEVIMNSVHHTIGGPLQFGILYESGLELRTLKWSDDPRFGPWHTATPLPGQLARYQARHIDKLGPDWIPVSAFDLHDLGS